MLRTLNDYHQRIAAGLNEIRSVCRCDIPDLDSLDQARVTLTRISMERNRFINQVVLTRILGDCTYQSSRDMLLLLNTFAANRALSDRHISHWTNTTIGSDWDGYRRAASTIWQMMEQQMSEETMLVTKYLHGVHL